MKLKLIIIAAYHSILTSGKGASRCRSPTCQDSWWLTLKILSREKKGSSRNSRKLALMVNLAMWSWMASLAFSDKRGKGPALEEYKMCAGFIFFVFVCFSCVCYKWGCLGQRHLWNRHCLKIPSMREKSPDWWNMKIRTIVNWIDFSQYHQSSHHLFCQETFHTLSWGGALQMSNATSCLFCCCWKVVKTKCISFPPKVFLIICIQISLLSHTLKVWLLQVWHTLLWTNWELIFNNMVMWK